MYNMHSRRDPIRLVQALRYSAAVLVVVAHACYYSAERYDDHTPQLAGIAGYGVWLFFAISGFVMVLVADDLGHAPASWSEFARARLARVAPLYWFMTTIKVVAVVAASSLVVNSALDPGTVLASYLFLPSHDEAGAIHPLWGVGWTLLFEMAFYALMTLALAIGIDPLKLCAPVLAIAAVASLLRPATGSTWWFYADDVTLYFLAGMIIARGWRARRPVPTVALLGVIAAFMGILASVRAERLDVAAAVIPLAISAVLMSAVWLEARLGRFVPRWVMVGGASSYALYLVHPLLAPAVPATFAAFGAYWVPWFAVVTVTVSTMLVVAPLAHRFVEHPLNRAAGRLLLPNRRARSASASKKAETSGRGARPQGQHDSGPTDTSVVPI
jgi:exopolysaccharide production protein ExoZ